MKKFTGTPEEGDLILSSLEQSEHVSTDEDDLADDIEEMVVEVEARIGRELTDYEREAFADEYLKQLDDSDTED